MRGKWTSEDHKDRNDNNGSISCGVKHQNS